ncbi:MAG: hypothetical protein AB7K24_13050 [Gemmataceae bacterium]
MNTTTQTPTYWTDAGVAGYNAVCLVATGVIFLALQRMGLDQAALFPVLAALLGIGTRWSTAPLLLLVTLAMCLSMGAARWLAASQYTGLRIVDFALCAAVLAYLLAFYRLQSIWSQVLPARPNLLEPNAKVEPIRRPARLIDAHEMGWLLILLPIWAAVPQVVWAMLPRESAIEVLIPPAYQAMVFVWVLAMVGLSVAGVLEYLHRCQMTRAEAMMVLQDELWHETRREQRQLNRWLAWDRRGRPSYLLPTLAVMAGLIALALIIILLI